jgi:hypothetical protein
VKASRYFFTNWFLTTNESKHILTTEIDD